MHLLDYISVAVSAVNVIIVLLLLCVYTKNYRNIKSKYTFGLIIFSLLFLVENLFSIYLGIFTWPLYANDINFFMVEIDTVELFGLSVLLYITWK
jgi:hypothetical protein